MKSNGTNEIDENALLSQALRFCGMPSSPEVEQLERFRAILQRVRSASSFRFTLLRCPVEKTDAGIRLEQNGLLLPGEMAKTMLAGCSEAIVLGASLGMGFEQALKKEQMLSMHDALIFDAIGSALIEAELDRLSAQLSDRLAPLYLTDRFSCGYGDLPLALQKDLGSLLALERTIGVYVLDSLMMSPSKSVTALIGISAKPQPARMRGCAFCSMNRNCPCRKGGKTCGSF